MADIGLIITIIGTGIGIIAVLFAIMKYVISIEKRLHKLKIQKEGQKRFNNIFDNYITGLVNKDIKQNSKHKK